MPIGNLHSATEGRWFGEGHQTILQSELVPNLSIRSNLQRAIVGHMAQLKFILQNAGDILRDLGQRLRIIGVADGSGKAARFIDDFGIFIGLFEGNLALGLVGRGLPVQAINAGVFANRANRFQIFDEVFAVAMRLTIK